MLINKGAIYPKTPIPEIRFLELPNCFFIAMSLASEKFALVSESLLLDKNLYNINILP